MNNFALCPLQDGYVPTIANPVLEQEGAVGFARQRVAFVNAVHVVAVTVAIPKKLHAQYFWAFWRSHTLTPKHFLWSLICDDCERQTYECQFIPSTLVVGERQGKYHKISFSVRCKPLNNNQLAFDQSIVDMWETGNPLEFENYLEKLVNEQLPAAAEGLS